MRSTIKNAIARSGADFVETSELAALEAQILDAMSAVLSARRALLATLASGRKTTGAALAQLRDRVEDAARRLATLERGQRIALTLMTRAENHRWT